jgi:hypothetical protein
MSFPPLLVGAAMLFWGWQTSNLLVAAPLALLLELPRFLSFRIELRETDHRRIADFCTALFTGVAGLLLVNRGAPRGVLGALQWFPIVLAPLILAQLYDRGGRIRMSALFHYMRRQMRRDPAMNDPLLDLSGAYAALLAIAAGASNTRGPGYYAGVVVLGAWALYAFRPAAQSRALFAALLLAAAGAGHFGHVGLSNLQGMLEAWVDEWLVVLPNDAERAQTRIGSIGRIKQHDTIALRLYAPEQSTVKLLHLASFNEYRNGTWHARGTSQEFTSARDEKDQTSAIVLRIQQPRTLLPLPPGVREVNGIEALARQSTSLGAVSVDALKGWLRYEVVHGQGIERYAPPGPADLALPAAERATVARIASELNLSNSPAPVAAIERHFASFAYSTFREGGPSAGLTGLEDFLLNAKSGHCEYFAAASTLLLRAAGIPARYATGYAVFEHSKLEGAWVVRARHAHAWTRAYIGGRWVDVDLTPPSWPEAEAGLAPVWEKLADLLRWAAFRWATRPDGETSPWWWVAGVLLALGGGWYLLRQRRAVRTVSPSLQNSISSGSDSEFYALERALASKYGARGSSETLFDWVSKFAPQMSAEERKNVLMLLDLHHRYRFDPLGITPQERTALRAAAPQ